MKFVADGKEMQALDNYTMETLGIPSLILMERAALSFAKRLAEELTEDKGVLCLCGTGNNGGDAVAVARILHSWGYRCAFYLIGEEENITKETKKQLEMARNVGVPEYNTLDLRHIKVVVDGIFGTGLSKSVRGIQAEIIEKINTWKQKYEHVVSVWSVDIPSGLNAASGLPMGDCILADVTVTFGLYKRGLLFYPGRDIAGKLFVEDIGFPGKALEMKTPQAYTFEPEDLKKMPKRRNDSHKGTYGRMLVIAGSKNMAGASYFAAKGASLTGSGLVRLFTVEENRMILQTKIPEAVLSTWTEDSLTEDTVTGALAWAEVVVIGPGLGTSRAAEKLMYWTLKNISMPLIMDADALNMLARHEEWMKLLPPETIITPHLVEMSRLTKRPVYDLKAHPADMALEYAKKHQLICVLKDAATVVASPEGKLYINMTGNNGMSAGGSGDVLTGIIGALLGVGVPSRTAAELGVYIHGLAGDKAREQVGTYSMTAENLLSGLVEIMRELDK